MYINGWWPWLQLLCQNEFLKKYIKRNKNDNMKQLLSFKRRENKYLSTQTQKNEEDILFLLYWILGINKHSALKKKILFFILIVIKWRPEMNQFSNLFFSWSTVWKLLTQMILRAPQLCPPNHRTLLTCSGHAGIHKRCWWHPGQAGEGGRPAGGQRLTFGWKVEGSGHTELSLAVNLPSFVSLSCPSSLLWGSQEDSQLQGAAMMRWVDVLLRLI